MPTAVVVVPIYKDFISECERVSLESIFRVLGGSHDIAFVKPCSLTRLECYNVERASRIDSFEDHFFEGLRGYNKLMLSREFYERFLDYDYILIAQLDSYIFRDELDEWCRKGYDYIGAPWLRPSKPFQGLRSVIKRWFCNLMGRPNSQINVNRVGNGGLSLRRVESCRRVVAQLDSVVQRYLSCSELREVFNEDIFFAIEPQRAGIEFKYPHSLEALRFSVDNYPSYCYQLLGNKLPMGTHGWSKKRMIRFWKPIILK